jgi:uncharacterized membrane protein YbhN (UPF0104 family)
MFRRLRKVTSSRWFKLASSVVLLAVLLHETDVAGLSGALHKAQPWWVVASLAGYIFSQVISAYRWSLLARPLGFRESFRRFLVYYFSGMYLNLFAPSTVAGDVGRALFLASGRRRALAMTTVVADRGTGAVALVLVGAAAIILLPQYPMPHIVRIGAWLAPPLVVAGWLWGPRLAVRLLSPDHRVRRFVEKDLAPYWHDLRLLGLTLVVATFFHLLQIATQVVLAWSLDVEAPNSFFLVFVPIVNLLGMLPVSFSGVGVREAGYWYFLSLVGIHKEAAIALGLLASAVAIASGVAGAPGFVLARQGRSNRRNAGRERRDLSD